MFTEQLPNLVTVLLLHYTVVGIMAVVVVTAALISGFVLIIRH